MGTELHVSAPTFRLDLVNQCLWRNDQSITLTPKAFTVLRRLMEHPGQLVTKEDLLDAAWPGVYVSDAALKVCIRRLRQALGDLSHPPRYIETVHWRGYRLLAPIVTTTAGTPSAEPYPPPPGTAARPAPIPASPNAPPATTVVGRETELQHLAQRLTQVAQGQRQVVLVTGPPGIGKTALIEEFLAQAAHTHAIRVARGQCVEQYGAGESYLPMLEALARLCRLPGGEETLAILQRYAPLWLAQIPSLLEPAEHKRLRREAKATSRERMLRELAEALEILAAEQLLVLVLEDLHWSDAATLDLLTLLARRREPARLLLLGEYRPEELPPQEHSLKNLRHDVHTHRQGEELAIAPLSLTAIASYLARRFPDHALPRSLAALLHRQTGGHPLFLVNLVDHLVAQAWIVKQQTWELTHPLTDIEAEVPINIQQIIIAQIDRLSAEQQHILEVASVAGVEFSAAAVAATSGEEIVEVEILCEDLARRGQFLRAQGVSEWPDGTVATRYEFLHSLYQQAWYERVTAGRKVQLHRRLGEREEVAYGEHSTEIAAELAVHFERGRDYERALRYRQIAAAKAMQRFGYQEAIGHLTHGLTLLAALPASPQRMTEEVTLQNALGTAYTAVHGYAAPTVEHAYARARTLSQQITASPLLVPALRGLWAFHLTRAELATARELAEQLLHLAQREQSNAFLLEAERELGQTLYFLGEPVAARHHFERSLALYDQQQHAQHLFLYGQDPGVVCLAQNARTLALLGYLDQARQQSEAAITLAKQAEHPYSQALAYFHAAIVEHLRGDFSRMHEATTTAITLSEEHGFPYWLSSAQVLEHWLSARQPDAESHLQAMRDSVVAHRQTGAMLNVPYSLMLLAEIAAEVGRTAEGLAFLDEAQTSIDASSGHFHQAELWRLRGELLLRQTQE